MNKITEKTVFKNKQEEKKKDFINPQIIKIAFPIMFIILLSVVFILPNFIDNQELKNKENSDVKNLMQDASILKMRPLAKTAEYQLSDKIQYLVKKGIDFWGVDYIYQLIEMRTQGEDAFIAEKYNIALDIYRQALDLSIKLELSIPDRLNDAINKGQTAILSGKKEEALNYFELALAIDPKNNFAISGYDRALKLDEVLDLMILGKSFFNNEEYQESINIFRQVLVIDPQWTDAIDSLAQSTEVFKENQFNYFLSSGYKFMRENNFIESRTSFEKAFNIFPSSVEATQAMNELNSNERIHTIKTLRYQGLILETKENWREAKLKYTKILQLDSNIDKAKLNLDRVNYRINLNKDIDYFISNADDLNDEVKFTQASLTLKNAENIKSIGPKLEERINKLKEILIIAANPLPVIFISDMNTNISIYKVGELGVFDRRILQLKPGKYTVIGSRRDYRDVRLEFIVSSEKSDQIFEIACKDSI